MHVGREDLGVHIIEGGWFGWIMGPALRVSGAEEIRALDEKVVIHGEELLVRWLSNEDIEELGDVVPIEFLSATIQTLGPRSGIVLEVSTYFVRFAVGSLSDILRLASVGMSDILLLFIRCVAL
jgi:hypothetical protein